MLRTGLVEVESEAGVARPRAFRRRAWFRRRQGSSRVSGPDRWTVMPPKQAFSLMPPSSWKHSGKSAARFRLARNPKLRMRTKPGRQQMEQEAAQELLDSQSHEPLLVAVRGIAPAEGDVAIGESDQPGVGDGDAMSVCAEIAQHMFRSSEGLLGVDDPVVAEQHPQPCSEGAWLRKLQQAAVELELTAMEGAAKSGDELAAEDAAEHADGQEEGAPGGDPA